MSRDSLSSEGAAQEARLSALAIKYMYLHYVHAQCDLGLFHVSDLGGIGELRTGIVPMDLLTTPMVDYLARQIVEGQSFFGEGRWPPASGTFR